MEKSFAEKLVAEHYCASINVTYRSDGPDRLAKAQANLIQALTVPAEKDDVIKMRDLFAMSIVSGQIAYGGLVEGCGGYGGANVSIWAYEMADAMIEARKPVS